MPKRSPSFWIFLIVIPIFMAGCFGLEPPGSQKRVTQTADILVFSDDNSNGYQDPGEAPIQNVLVIGESNIHGTNTRTGMLTNGDGQATITAEYTHFFNIQLIPPCGYQPTTPTNVDAQRKISFGFEPQSPQSGIAELRFHLWQDRNQDRVRQPDEPPIEGIRLYVIPELGGDYAGDVISGSLAIQTDVNGEATANLGNSCSEASVFLRSTQNLEYVHPEGKENNQLKFNYEIGLKEIELGLFAKE